MKRVCSLLKKRMNLEGEMLPSGFLELVDFFVFFLAID